MPTALNECTGKVGNRVLVVGCCGAGKSTFARHLSMLTGVPLVHLDKEYWRPGWIEPEKDQWTAKVETLIVEPRWIIDGNYVSTLPLRLRRADSVIFLDLPRRICVLRSILRILRGYGRTRADMTQNCPERFHWDFLKFVWNFRRDHRPRVIEALRGFHGTVVILKSPSAVAAFLSAAFPAVTRNADGEESAS